MCIIHDRHAEESALRKEVGWPAARETSTLNSARGANYIRLLVLQARVSVIKTCSVLGQNTSLASLVSTILEDQQSGKSLVVCAASVSAMSGPILPFPGRLQCL